MTGYTQCGDSTACLSTHVPLRTQLEYAPEPHSVLWKAFASFRIVVGGGVFGRAPFGSVVNDAGFEEQLDERSDIIDQRNHRYCVVWPPAPSPRWPAYIADARCAGLEAHGGLERSLCGSLDGLRVLRA